MWQSNTFVRRSRCTMNEANVRTGNWMSSILKNIEKLCRGQMIFGVGINDSDESTVVFGNVSGKRIVVYRCPYFSVWRGMLKRVCSGEYPSYDGVSVCQEWLSFSNFKDWMIHQPYEGR